MSDAPVRVQVDQVIADALKPYPWLYELIKNGVAPDTAEIGVGGAINGLLATGVGVINALGLIAGELDELRKPPEVDI